MKVWIVLVLFIASTANAGILQNLFQRLDLQSLTLQELQYGLTQAKNIIDENGAELLDEIDSIRSDLVALLAATDAGLAEVGVTAAENENVRQALRSIRQIARALNRGLRDLFKRARALRRFRREVIDDIVALAEQRQD
ncbi:CLUMA_CG008610, isoform A [Clunio marinus]|uniref:CLUMA_CG008610, isoform A n=1 Tax=Clunio marinus TaxID=568069 RepID=A0A1J1I6D0_9DIPT|nr:CLUMA_CG008610, isoform A [Clunio marinus]